MELYMTKLYFDFLLVFQNSFIKFMSKKERKGGKKGE